MGEHDEFIADFLEECDENLDQLDQELVALEEDPRNEERLRRIFRNIHTIKGSSGFFGFVKLGALAHEGETLLGRIRDGELTFNQAIASGLLQMADAIREILSSIEQSGGEGERDYEAVAEKLRSLLVEGESSKPTLDFTDTTSKPTVSKPTVSKPTDGASQQAGQTDQSTLLPSEPAHVATGQEVDQPTDQSAMHAAEARTRGDDQAKGDDKTLEPTSASLRDTELESSSRSSAPQSTAKAVSNTHLTLPTS